MQAQQDTKRWQPSRFPEGPCPGDAARTQGLLGRRMLETSLSWGDLIVRVVCDLFNGGPLALAQAHRRSWDQRRHASAVSGR